MTWYAWAIPVALLFIVIGVAICVVCLNKVRKAVRYAVTLKHNEGAFVALRVETHWDRWVFEDIKLVPINPGAQVAQAAPGRLHVPKRNILYYQEMANVVE